jgi:hypothetical protein
MAGAQTSEVDENLQQSAWDYKQLSLVAVVTTPISYDSWTHTSETMAPTVGPTVLPR